MNNFDPVTIARRMASALKTSVELFDVVSEHFQNQLSVYMDSIGALEGADAATIAEHLTANGLSSFYPYILVGALQHDDGPVVSEDEIQVGIIVVIDSAIDKDGNKINTAMPELAEDGVFEVGRSPALVALVEAIKSALMLSSVNGIIHTFSTAYNAGGQYPIQSASLTVTLKTVTSF